MSSKTGHGKTNNNNVCSTLKQGDVILVNFGSRHEGSRSLYGRRPVYVLSNNADDKTAGVILVVPLFRSRSRDNSEIDIEISPVHCRGLHFTEYAQAMNIRKINKRQIIRRIGRIRNDVIHGEIMTSVWKLMESKDGQQ